MHVNIIKLNVVYCSDKFTHGDLAVLTRALNHESTPDLDSKPEISVLRFTHGPDFMPQCGVWMYSQSSPTHFSARSRKVTQHFAKTILQTL